MLCVGGADNLLSLDYLTIIRMQRMRVKTFLQKISKKFLSEFHPKKTPKFFRKIILRKFP